MESRISFFETVTVQENHLFLKYKLLRDEMLTKAYRFTYLERHGFIEEQFKN